MLQSFVFHLNLDSQSNWTLLTSNKISVNFWLIFVDKKGLFCLQKEYEERSFFLNEKNLDDEEYLTRKWDFD